jgi:hypothetical protein
MNLSATIAKMRAAGLSSEAILAVLECIVLEAKPEKSGAARRQAAYRERNALRNKRNSDVTSDELVSPLGPPLEGFPTPLPKTPPIIPPSSKKPKAHALPSDWEPDAKTWNLADQLGFTSQEAWDQLERMRDWAANAGAKGLKSDWNGAFRNWLKRAADDRRNKPQAAVQRNNNTDSFAILDAVFDEAIRRTDGSGEAGSEEDNFELPGLRKSAA